MASPESAAPGPRLAKTMRIARWPNDALVETCPKFRSDTGAIADPSAPHHAAGCVAVGAARPIRSASQFPPPPSGEISVIPRISTLVPSANVTDEGVDPAFGGGRTGVRVLPGVLV